MSLTISYKGSPIYTLTENSISGDTKNINTQGKYCDADIVVTCENGLFPDIPDSSYDATVITPFDETIISTLSATLILDESINVQIKINVASGYDAQKFTFNGFLANDEMQEDCIKNIVRDGQQILVYLGYKTTADFVKMFDLTINYDGTEIGRMLYGVGTFAKSRWNRTSDPKMAKAMRALWAYALAINALRN